MAASTAWRTHHNSCQPCRSGQHCATGAQLFERFARLQDAYLTEQRRKR
ncbi:hypothetical protein LRE75_30465 [Streptomyces sp. 372A]